MSEVRVAALARPAEGSLFRFYARTPFFKLLQLP